METTMHYEVETRIYFTSKEEAFHFFPFLPECLTTAIHFSTYIYGEELYNTGKLLRFSHATGPNEKKIYIGYKEPDLGKVCNIRQELDEDITFGVSSSVILQKIADYHGPVSPATAPSLLESFGHHPFLHLTGINLHGFWQEESISLKLIDDSNLPYPIILELEKSATNLEEAFRQESSIIEIIRQYQLEQRIIRDEPPALYLRNR